MRTTRPLLDPPKPSASRDPASSYRRSDLIPRKASDDDDSKASDDDDSEPVLLFRDIDSSSPGSAIGSVTSNDDDNFFGPVLASFIRSGRLSETEASEDNNHDITLDSTAFSLHYQSVAPPDEHSVNSAGSIRTPTRDEAFDDRIGVAVQFEDEYEDDDDDYQYVNQVEEEFEEEEDGPESTMQIDGIVAADLEEASEAMTVNVQNIDAYWLQRTISRAFVDNDASQSQKLSEEVLKVLDDGQGDELSVESRLVVLLEYEKFDLVKLLLHNRLKIAWCTRLARAEGEEQMKRIEAKMEAASPSHVVILEQLHAMRASAKERKTNLKKSIRDETKRLKDDCSGSGDDREVNCEWLKTGCQTLPLETLAFHQGGLLMSKEKCVLPPEEL